MGCCSMPQSDEGPFACPQEIADEAQGENVLVVTHGDAVNASVSRIWPWAIVHPVTHTGYTVASRERRPGQQLQQDCEDSADVRWHCHDGATGCTLVHVVCILSAAGVVRDTQAADPSRALPPGSADQVSNCKSTAMTVLPAMTLK